MIAVIIAVSGLILFDMIFDFSLKFEQIQFENRRIEIAAFQGRGNK